jgi:hypothetical protein
VVRDGARVKLAGQIRRVKVGAWLWEIAQGHDGSPYSQLGAVAGIGYILTVAVLRRRS